jgi:hypothetical protein
MADYDSHNYSAALHYYSCDLPIRVIPSFNSTIKINHDEQDEITIIERPFFTRLLISCSGINRILHPAAGILIQRGFCFQLL